MAAIELYSTPLFTDANLEYYVRLENNLTDSGPNSISASGTDVTYNTGEFGNAVVSNGSSTTIDLASDANLDFGTGSWTVAFWVYPTNRAAGAQDWLGRAGGSGGYHITRINTNGSILVQIYQDGSNFFNYTSSGTPISSDSNWFHITVVFDRPNSISRLYVNGSENTTGAVTGNPTLDAATFFTICDHQFSGVYCAGRIDDVAFYSRVLTPTEITNLANGTWPTSGGGRHMTTNSKFW